MLSRPTRPWKLGGLVAVLSAATLAAALVPEIPLTLRAPGLNLVVGEAAAIVAALSSLLAWQHYCLTRERGILLVIGGLLALFCLQILLLLAHLSVGGSGFSPAAAHAVLYGRTTIQLVGVASICAGLFDVLRALPSPMGRVPMVAVVVGPSLVGLVVAALGARFEPDLPALVARDALATFDDQVLSTGLVVPVTQWNVALQGSIGILAALGSVRAWQQVHREPLAAILAVGLIFTAVGQVHAAMAPAFHPAIETTGDLLGFGFYLSLAIGGIVSLRDATARLRAAMSTEAELTDVQIAGAVLRERNRIAREVHDGIAQDLWLARLRLEEVETARASPEARAALRVVDEIISRALEDARSSVLALRTEDVSTALDAIIRRQAEAFTFASGVPVQITVEGTVTDLTARTAAHLSRILTEALTNVHKHADATLVRVSVEADEALARLSITDNGAGFEVHKVSQGFGLESMAERASLVGGELTIESAPFGGTRLVLDVPLRRS